MWVVKTPSQNFTPPQFIARGRKTTSPNMAGDGNPADERRDAASSNIPESTVLLGGEIDLANLSAPRDFAYHDLKLFTGHKKPQDKRQKGRKRGVVTVSANNRHWRTTLPEPLAEFLLRGAAYIKVCLYY